MQLQVLQDAPRLRGQRRRRQDRRLNVRRRGNQGFTRGELGARFVYSSWRGDKDLRGRVRPRGGAWILHLGENRGGMSALAI